MVEAQRAGSSLSQGSESGVIKDIESNILNAVNVLLDRVLSGGSESEIEDRKSDSTANCTGTVQDCEFGLMVLSSRAWLQQQGRLEGQIAKELEVRDLLIRLLRKTIQAISIKSSESTKNIQGKHYTGGEIEDSPVWFRGDPYTNVLERRQIYFSANLDSAMLILAFFASALLTYNDELLSAEFVVPTSLQGAGIGSLRDAVLLGCKEALRYAVQCRVEENEKFQGFTCDPTSNAPSTPASLPGLIPEDDRLFFTWTTCETLHELEQSKWAQYLDEIEASVAVPELVGETKKLLTRLIEDLGLASRWCRETFLDRFRGLVSPEIANVVSAFVPLGVTGQPDLPLMKKRDEIGEFVKNVYSISQYAAIRSIVPSGSSPIAIEEVREVASVLKNLVIESILKSGLDEAPHRELYPTLTRGYKLGNSNGSLYEDDAYFPLVVRSLAGLLTRTITYLSGRRESILLLVADYRGYLQDLYKELVIRRPQDADAERGDEYLWSVAKKRPFVLYATQRTIFALLAYKDFLSAMAVFEANSPPERPSAASPEEELRDLLARSLAANLLAPVIEGFVRQARNLLAVPASSVLESDHGEVPQSLFPRDEWSHHLLREWLTRFTKEFDTQLGTSLMADADCLIELRDSLRTAAQNGVTGKLTEDMQKAMEGLLKVEGLRSLYDENRWEEELIAKALLEHLLQQFLPLDGTLRTRMRDMPLWKTIQTAKTRIESYNQKLDTKQARNEPG